MTNRIAIFLGLSIFAAIAVDYVMFDLAASVFLGRKFVSMLDWIKFWR